MNKSAKRQGILCCLESGNAVVVYRYLKTGGQSPWRDIGRTVKLSALQSTSLSVADDIVLCRGVSVEPPTAVTLPDNDAFCDATRHAALVSINEVNQHRARL